MIFRVGWWMKNNDDYYTLRRLVNRAIVKNLKEAGVVFPYRKEPVDYKGKYDENFLPTNNDNNEEKTSQE